MTVAAPEQDEYTPHASSTAVLKEAQLELVEAQSALSKIDLRSIKSDFRAAVKEARTAVDSALKVSRRG